MRFNISYKMIMNKKILHVVISAAATILMSVSIGANIVQKNQKKKVKNEYADLQNKYANLQNEDNMVKADKEALKKRCFNMENVIKSLREENNGFREKEYKQHQEEKQKEDEMKAIEDFEFEGLDGMESIS